MPADFPIRFKPSPALERSADALRQQQPPRNGVTIPGVDDGVHLLIEQVAFYHLHRHGSGQHSTLISRVREPRRSLNRILNLVRMRSE